MILNNKRVSRKFLNKGIKIDQLLLILITLLYHWTDTHIVTVKYKICDSKVRGGILLDFILFVTLNKCSKTIQQFFFIFFLGNNSTIIEPDHHWLYIYYLVTIKYI